MSFAKIETVIAILIAVLLIGTPLVFSGNLNSPFALPEAVFFRIMTNLIIFVIIFYFWKTKFYISLKKFLISPFGFLIIIYFSIQIIATIFSIAPAMSMFGNYFRQQGMLTQLHYLLFILILVIFLQLPSFRNYGIKYLFTISLLAGVLPAIYAIFQKIGLDPLFSAWQQNEFAERVFGTLGQPTFLAQFLILTIASSCALFFVTTQRKFKSLIILCISIQALALLFTVSRAGIIGFWLFLCIFGLGVSWFYKKKIGYIVTILLLIILPLTFSLLTPKLIDIKTLPSTSALVRLVPSKKSLLSLKTRTFLWPMALRMFLDHPLLGQGPETFHLTFPKYKDPRLLTETMHKGIADRAHNILLDIMISSGLLGLFSYGSFLILLFIKIFQALRRNKFHKNSILLISLTAGVLGFLLADMFGFQIIPHSLLFWTTLVLIFFIINPINFEAVKIKRRHTFLFASLAVILISVINIISWNIKPVLADYYFKKGLERQIVDYKEAGNFFKKSVKIYPLEPIYHIYNTKYLLDDIKQSGNKEKRKQLIIEASKSLVNLFTLLPEYNEVYMLYGNALEISASDYENAGFFTALAEEALEKSKSLAPNSLFILSELGGFYFRHNKFEEAIQNYEYILEISPLYWKWSDKELNEKNQSEREQYNIFFRNYPNFRDVFLKLGRSYAVIKDFEKALFYLEFGVQDVDVLSTKAVIYAQQNNLKKALELTKKALELDPENTILKENLKKLQNL